MYSYTWNGSSKIVSNLLEFKIRDAFWTHRVCFLLCKCSPEGHSQLQTRDSSVPVWRWIPAHLRRHNTHRLNETSCRRNSRFPTRPTNAKVKVMDARLLIWHRNSALRYVTPLIKVDGCTLETWNTTRSLESTTNDCDGNVKCCQSAWEGRSASVSRDPTELVPRTKLGCCTPDMGLQCWVEVQAWTLVLGE